MHIPTFVLEGIKLPRVILLIQPSMGSDVQETFSLMKTSYEMGALCFDLSTKKHLEAFRELKNLVERLMIMTPRKTIEVSDLPDSFREVPLRIPAVEIRDDGETLKEATSKFERDFILMRLIRNSGNVSKTAEQIGIARRNLHRKIRQLGIRVGRQEEV